MNHFLGRIHCLRPSLPLKLKPNRTSIPLLAFPTAPSQTSLPNTHFSLDYLVQSCGLSSEEALKASKHIQHLKSPDKPDAVLEFLREIGVSEPDITKAVSRGPRILCSSLEKNWKPSIAKLRGLGLSTQDISGIVSRKPFMFLCNIVPKVEFLIQALGSAEFMSVLLGGDASCFCSSIENVLMPNTSFLKGECGLSSQQIVQLIKANPRLFTCKPELLKMQAERADALGVPRSKKTFLHALIIVGYLNQSTVDARLKNLILTGFSEEEVASLVSKVPLVFNASNVACFKEFICVFFPYCKISSVATEF